VAWLHILLPKAEGNIEPLLLSLSQNMGAPHLARFSRDVGFHEGRSGQSS
jgi:hypothetical protein